jgi:NAD(P)H-dependent flavin oxidoreductase YrpB (nitropropane dioxygenase family)
MFRTRITDAYGLEAPIVSAGMARIARPPLVAAVSNAGGLGTLGAAMVAPAALRHMLWDVRRLTSRPYAVAFTTDCVGIEHVEVCIGESVPVVVFSLSLPERRHVARLRSNGIQVWVQVGSVADARAAKAMGADAIIAQGQEGGGHNRAEAATFSLLPAVREAVAPVPVIAAGGIVDGRSLVGAMALGAEAVWCGTRFLASTEAHAHDVYKARIVQAGVGDTVRTALFGPEWPDQSLRVIRNRVVAQSHGTAPREDSRAHPPIGRTRLGDDHVDMPKFSALPPTPETVGDFEEMCLPAGEGAGNIQSIRPAAAIVAAMMSEAHATIDLLSAIAHGGFPRFNDRPRPLAVAASR